MHKPAFLEDDENYDAVKRAMEAMDVDPPPEGYVTLVARDGATITVSERDLLHASNFLRSAFAETSNNRIVHCVKLNGQQLEQLREFLQAPGRERNADGLLVPVHGAGSTDASRAFVANWLQGMENPADHMAQIFQVILAANYLDIPDLIDAACLKIAHLIKGKTPQQIRDMFNIANDFTPEEEEEVKRQNAWAFE